MKIIFQTYRFSARRVVENYFGILASRFRILLRPIQAEPDAVKSITLSAMILHNLLVESIGPESVVDRYGISSAFNVEDDFGLVGNVPNDAKQIRHTVMNYLCWRDGVR